MLMLMGMLMGPLMTIICKIHEVNMSSPRNKWKPWDLAMFHMGKDGKVTEM
jgi:hypothetical protein